VRPERLAVALGLLLTLAIAALHVVYNRHAGPLWRDEVNSLNVALMPSLGEVLATSGYDSFPAAWTLLLHAWVRSGLGATTDGLRLLGLAIGLGTLAIIWWTGRRLGVAAPLATLLLVGMSPTTIIYGDEVRGYGLALLAILWVVGALWGVVQRPSGGRIAVAQAAAILAVQSHYVNCFLLLGVSLAAAGVCVARRAWRACVAIFAIGAVAALSLAVNLPGLRYAAGLAPIYRGSWDLAWFANMLMSARAPDVPVLEWAWLVALAVAIPGLVLGIRAGRDGDRVRYVAAALVLASLAFAVFLRLVQVRSMYWYYLPILAFAALCADVALDELARRVRRVWPAQLVAVALVALAALPSVASAVRIRMTNLDVIAATISKDARPDDLVVVLPWYYGISFAHHYRGATPWITLPAFDDHRFHFFTTLAEKMRRGDAVGAELERVARTLQDGGRVWVVGTPSVPPPGETAAPPAPATDLATAPPAGDYEEAWERQLGGLLRDRGRDTWKVQLADVGRVNVWENHPLLLVEGWRPAPGPSSATAPGRPSSPSARPAAWPACGGWSSEGDALPCSTQGSSIPG
jgi:hypothetical protein